ncbi:MAG TPA: hypothetical protein VM261_16165 [Kofleriaceae bacterium]|nr:hypothetical protein [Kofleriaceae bacterium]
MTAPPTRDERLKVVRRSVRGVLDSTPAFAQAAPDVKRDLAKKMVTVAMMGTDLAAEEEIQKAKAVERFPAMTAAQEFGDATRAAGRTFREIREAIDFPTYVQQLISGVFQAITQSNISQLTAIGDMLDAVSRTEDEFTSENIRDADVMAWAAGKFPFMRIHEGTLQARDGVDLSEKASEIAAQLRVSASEVSSLDESDLMGTLGPLIRQRIGRERQQMLATMVQMGLQRVVVDEGRLHASMDMRVDTRSAQNTQQARREELDVDAGASAQMGMGIWGASAHLNVGYNKVQADSSSTNEEIATRAGLRSSVDLAFRTDQIPLDRMASRSQRARLDANARVPATVSDGGSMLSNAPSAPGLPDMNRRTVNNSDTQQASAARTAAQAEERRQAQRQEGIQDEERRRRQTQEDEDRRRAAGQPAQPAGQPAQPAQPVAQPAQPVAQPAQPVQPAAQPPQPAALPPAARRPAAP